MKKVDFWLPTHFLPQSVISPPRKLVVAAIFSALNGLTPKLFFKTSLSWCQSVMPV